MANEFIARKGIISLDSIQVSGSITATGGITVSGSISSASFATSAATASSADNFFVRQNLTASSALFTGSITAQTLVVQTVTSSIVYSSGSNIFGNLPSNVQQFTGSLRVTGSGNHWVIGGNVGLGTSSPSYNLHIQGASPRIWMVDTTTNGSCFEVAADTTSVGIFNRSNLPLILGTNNATKLTISAAGDATFVCTVAVNGNNLTVQPSTTTTYALSVMQNTGGYLRVGRDTSTGVLYGTAYAGLVISSGAYPLLFGTNDSERMRITSGGNIGIGTTNATGQSADNRVIQIYGAGAANRAQIHFANSNTGETTTDGSFIGIDSSCGLYIVNRETADTIFENNGSERMRITSGGNLLLGTSSEYGSGFKFQVNGSAYITGIVYSNAGFYINSGQYNSITETPYTGIYMTGAQSADGFGALLVTSRTDTARPIIFGTSNGTNSVERMRITSGGNVRIYNSVGIGLNTGTDPSTRLHIKRADSTGVQEILRLDTGNDANNDGSYINWTTGDGGTQVARIGGQRAGTDIGILLFETGNGSNGYTERMRIACNGAVYINTDSNQLANATPALGILAGTTCDAVNIKHVQNGNNSVNIWQTGTSAFGAIVFYKGNTQDERGNITVSTTGTSFNSVSDYRLKENVTLSSCGLDRLMQLKPSKFNWIQTGEEAEGFIAHELQEVFPYAVTGEKDGVYSSTGNIKPQSVDYGRITPLLVKAIQEQQCQICTQSIIIDQLKTCLGII